MKKRVLSILLTLCVALTALPLSGVPALAATSGDFEYRVLSETDKTCEITDYTGSAAELEIPATLDGYTVTSIGMGAIDSCSSLTNIDIPDSVTSIGNGAFGFCPLLASIDVAAENPSYSSQDGVLFTKDKTVLMKYPAKKQNTAYGIPNTVTSIGDDAFENCALLTSIDIPNGVTNIGDNAFAYCTSLTSITIPGSVTSIGHWAFNGCNDLTIYGVAGSYAETYAEQNAIPFISVPVLVKDRSQVRFTAENGEIADAFDYRLISSIPDVAWDSYFDNGSGGTTITAVGFVAANLSDRATLAGAQAAVESGTALPAGWKTADTDYIQKAGDDADAYFGCIIQGIKHSEQTEDIVCSAYIAYTTAAGQTAYVWYDAPVVALVATNYDAAADAWRAANA